MKTAMPTSDNSYFDTGACASLVHRAVGVTYDFPCTGIGSVVVAKLNLNYPQYLAICELEVYGKSGFLIIIT